MAGHTRIADDEAKFVFHNMYLHFMGYKLFEFHRSTMRDLIELGFSEQWVNQRSRQGFFNCDQTLSAAELKRQGACEAGAEFNVKKVDIGGLAIEAVV